MGSLPVLIQATKFHKGLMACCLEVVIAAYKWVMARRFIPSLDFLRTHSPMC